MPFPDVFNVRVFDLAMTHYLRHCNSDDFDDFLAYRGQCTGHSAVPEVAERIEQYFGAFMRYYQSGDYEEDQGHMHDQSDPLPTPEDNDVVMIPAMRVLAALQTESPSLHCEEG